MTRLQAIEASFIHWTENYGLVCKRKLYNSDLQGDKCALCISATGCATCPLACYGMECWAKSSAPWGDVYLQLPESQPKRPVEVMTLCLLLVYYAEGGKKVWK